MLKRLFQLIGSSLRRAINSFLLHYHGERNHQGLKSKIIEPEPGVGSGVGAIERRTRLGGLLNYYYRRAG